MPDLGQKIITSELCFLFIRFDSFKEVCGILDSLGGTAPCLFTLNTTSLRIN